MREKRKKRISEMSVFNDIRALLAPTEPTGTKAYKNARLIDIKLIQSNPGQPRQAMDRETLTELAKSIQDIGLLQPIVVRQEGDIYRIIAGHRRFEAWKTVTDEPIPCIVRQADELEALEQSLIENVQREKLDEVDEARCYSRLMKEFGYTMEQLAQRLRKSLGYVDSRLKLLRHEDIAQAVKAGKLGIFEARELAKVEDASSRSLLLEKAARGQLDREGLKQEVRHAIGKDFQRLKVAQLEGLRDRISKIDLSKFDSNSRHQAHAIILEMQQLLTHLLSQD